LVRIYYICECCGVVVKQLDSSELVVEGPQHSMLTDSSSGNRIGDDELRILRIDSLCDDCQNHLTLDSGRMYIGEVRYH
jgi:hypothetical protein